MPWAPRGESGSTGAGGTVAVAEAGGGGRQGGAMPRRGEGTARAQEPARGPGRGRAAAGRGTARPWGVMLLHGLGARAVRCGTAWGGLAAVARPGRGRPVEARARAAAKLGSALLC
ncbi:uncharacterized protein [Miscanthus floridulus]|uniref:uncharacterized protein n=1 Tax=Miscanthus floridulus TaxID=154761 RepID=UPI00345755BB